MANWGNINNTRRKPTSIGLYFTFDDQLYGRTVLVRPYSCARIVAIKAAASNSFAPWNWIGETTYRKTRSRRNLTSGRDLEGELIHREIHLRPTQIREAKPSIFIGNRCITTISIHPIYISYSSCCNSRTSCGFIQVLFIYDRFHYHCHDVDCLYV
jgi:hypothetical protein